MNSPVMERNETGDLFNQIGGLLGIDDVHTEVDLARVNESGLPVVSIVHLANHGFNDQEISHLVIPTRTLTHRKQKGQPLNVEESGKAIRLARVTSLAQIVFGNREKAFRWLRKPKQKLDDRSPLDMVASESGARLIEEMLYQIDEGMFA